MEGREEEKYRDTGEEWRKRRIESMKGEGEEREGREKMKERKGQWEQERKGGSEIEKGRKRNK